MQILFQDLDIGDNGIKVTGDAVFSLSLIFLSDWEFSTKETIDFSKYYRKVIL